MTEDSQDIVNVSIGTRFATLAMLWISELVSRVGRYNNWSRIGKPVQISTACRFLRFVIRSSNGPLAHLTSVRSSSGRRASLLYALKEPDNPCP